MHASYEGQKNHHITTTAFCRAHRLWILVVEYCSGTKYMDKLQDTNTKAQTSDYYKVCSRTKPSRSHAFS